MRCYCKQIQVCLLHVFLHVRVYTKTYVSYAYLELNVCQHSANRKYPQQQGKYTKAVNINSTSISHTHKKQNLKPKKQQQIAQQGGAYVKHRDNRFACIYLLTPQSSLFMQAHTEIIHLPAQKEARQEVRLLGKHQCTLLMLL